MLRLARPGRRLGGALLRSLRRPRAWPAGPSAGAGSAPRPQLPRRLHCTVSASGSASARRAVGSVSAAARLPGRRTHGGWRRGSLEALKIEPCECKIKDGEIRRRVGLRSGIRGRTPIAAEESSSRRSAGAIAFHSSGMLRPGQRGTARSAGRRRFESRPVRPDYSHCACTAVVRVGAVSAPSAAASPPPLPPLGPGGRGVSYARRTLSRRSSSREALKTYRACRRMPG